MVVLSAVALAQSRAPLLGKIVDKKGNWTDASTGQILNLNDYVRTNSRIQRSAPLADSDLLRVQSSVDPSVTVSYVCDVGVTCTGDLNIARLPRPGSRLLNALEFLKTEWANLLRPDNDLRNLIHKGDGTAGRMKVAVVLSKGGIVNLNDLPLAASGQNGLEYCVGEPITDLSRCESHVLIKTSGSVELPTGLLSFNLNRNTPRGKIRTGERAFVLVVDSPAVFAERLKLLEEALSGATNAEDQDIKLVAYLYYLSLQ